MVRPFPARRRPPRLPESRQRPDSGRFATQCRPSRKSTGLAASDSTDGTAAGSRNASGRTFPTPARGRAARSATAAARVRGPACRGVRPGQTGKPPPGCPARRLTADAHSPQPFQTPCSSVRADNSHIVRIRLSTTPVPGNCGIRPGGSLGDAAENTCHAHQLCVRPRPRIWRQRDGAEGSRQDFNPARGTLPAAGRFVHWPRHDTRRCGIGTMPQLRISKGPP